jgi:hypothetical protein
MNTESPWVPILIGLAGLATGLGLAYVVTRPKSIETLAHERLMEDAVKNHVKRLKRSRLRSQ